MPNNIGWDDDLGHDYIPIGSVAVAALMAAPVIVASRITDNKVVVYVTAVIMCIISIATGRMQYLALDLFAVFLASAYEVERLRKLHKGSSSRSGFRASHYPAQENLNSAPVISKSIITETQNLIGFLSDESKARVMIWMGMIYENFRGDPRGEMVLNWPSMVPYEELKSSISELESFRLNIIESIKQARAYGTLNDMEITHMTGSLHAYNLLVSSVLVGVYPECRIEISGIWTELFKSHEFIDSVAPNFHSMLMRAAEDEVSRQSLPSIQQLRDMAYFVPKEFSKTD